MGIVSIIITVISLLIIAFSMLLGIKRGLWGTVIKIVAVIVTFLIAFVIAKLIGGAFGGKIGEPLDFLRRALPGEFGELLDSSPSFLSVAKSGIAAAVSPFVFTVVFFIFFFLMIIPEHFAAKGILKGKKGSAIGGAILSSVVGLMLVFALLLPVAGILRTVNVAKNNLEEVDGETADDIRDAYGEYVSPLFSNIFVRFTSITTAPLFNGLTVIKTKDASSSLYNASDVGSRLAADLIPLADSDKITKKEVKYIEKFASDFEETEIIPSFAGEVLSSAVKEWKKGNSYLDFEPDFDDSGRFDELTDTLYDILGTSDKNTVKSDVREVSKLLSLLAEKDAFELSESDADIGKTLSREGLVSGAVDILFSYERFRPVTVDFLNIALDYAGEELGFDEQTKRDIRLDKSALDALTDKDIAEESLRMEDTVVRIFDFVESVNGKDVFDADIVSLGKALDNASGSIVLGSKVKLILGAVLKSQSMQDLKLFPDKVIDMIVDGDISYEKTFEAADKAIDVIKSIENASESGKPIDKGTVEESLNWLVENMDPSVSEILSSAVSPEFITECGLPEESAEGISSLFSDYFEKLGGTNTLESEQIRSEIDCLSSVCAAAASADNEKGDMFGGVLGSPDEFVEAFMDSEMFASSVVDTVYKNGKPAIDPFGVREYVSANDEKAIRNSLEKYYRANCKKAADKNGFNKKIISAGSVFGIDLTSAVKDWAK